jgi:hypothetical protein
MTIESLDAHRRKIQNKEVLALIDGVKVSILEHINKYQDEGTKPFDDCVFALSDVLAGLIAVCRIENHYSDIDVAHKLRTPAIYYNRIQKIYKKNDHHE